MVLVGVGCGDPGAIFEICVGWNNDRFAGAEAFENEAMAVFGFGSEGDGAAFGGVVRGGDPDPGVVEESGFGDEEGETSRGGRGALVPAFCRATLGEEFCPDEHIRAQSVVGIFDRDFGLEGVALKVGLPADPGHRSFESSVREEF